MYPFPLSSDSSTVCTFFIYLFIFLSGIDITVQWNEKRPTRLPEGLNLVFSPVQRTAYKWWLNKIDDMIDPLDVVVNASQRLHGKSFMPIVIMTNIELVMLNKPST